MENLKVIHAQNRIAKLSNNPVENASLIKKWQRILRNMSKNS